MSEEPLLVRSCHALLVHPVPERMRPTHIVSLDAIAETVDFKEDDSTSLPTKRTSHSPLRPARYNENTGVFEPADEVVEGCATETRKQITGFFAKLAQAGLKRLGFGNGTQKQQIY